MSDGAKNPRPPRPQRPGPFSRVLLSLLRGRGSEFVKGDLMEWWHRHYSDPSSGRVTVGFPWAILKSLGSWWMPGAILRRRRLRKAAALASSPLGEASNDVMSSWEWTTDFISDIRVAVRSLLRRPAFLLVTTLVMATGMAATVSVYTVVDRVLLRPLPYPEADRLVALGTLFSGREFHPGTSLHYLAGFSMANYQDWRQRARSFDDMAAMERTSILLNDPDTGPTLAASARVDAGFFSLLEVRPRLGRVFSSDEYSITSPGQLALISYNTWQVRYGGDPDILGSESNSGGLQIIGVLPEGFRPPDGLALATEYWLPLQSDSDRYLDRGRRSLNGFSRLAPGVTLETARAEMAGVAVDLAREFPDGNVSSSGAFGTGVNSLQAQTVGTAGRGLSLFLGAAGLLLFIAALNTANLFMVRGLNRDQEVGVRVALGAGRLRLIRHVLTETVILATAGGTLGVVLAYGGIHLLRTYGPASLPRIDEVAIDIRVIATALLVTVGCGLITGILPALRISNDAPGRRLRSGSRTFSSKRSRTLWWTLVGGQVAFSLVLLVGANLLFQSFLNLRSYDPGFDPGQALTFRQGWKPSPDEDAAAHVRWDQILSDVASVPGVIEVAGASNLPFQNPDWAPPILFPGEDPETTERRGISGFVITPNFFDVLDTRILAGRRFDSQDQADGESVAIVNQAFVDQEMDVANAVNQTLHVRGQAASNPGGMRIVGVVENVVREGPEEGPIPAVYFPHTQVDWPGLWGFARTAGSPDVLSNPVRRAIALSAGGIPTLNMMSMEDRIARTQVSARFSTMLFATFAGAALLLSASGLYGALAYLVRQRSKEIGLRMALGANASSVVRLIMSQGLAVTLAGSVVGLALAAVTTRWIGAFLFDVEALDPLIFLGATGFLALAAFAATLGPALAAVRVDPLESLTGSDQ